MTGRCEARSGRQSCPSASCLSGCRSCGAALRWAIRDLIRVLHVPTRGKHAKKPRPRLAIICFLISAGILAGVVYPSWNQHLTLAQDLWEGPVRHERVACEAFNDGNGSVSPKSRSWKYLQFRLVGDDGYSQSFRFKRVDLDQETDRQGSPFNTILGACESPETRMSVSVYPRTGVISEARASKVARNSGRRWGHECRCSTAADLSAAEARPRRRAGSRKDAELRLRGLS